MSLVFLNTLMLRLLFPAAALGVAALAATRDWGLCNYLELPFVGKISGYTINRRQWSRPGEEDKQL